MTIVPGSYTMRCAARSNHTETIVRDLALPLQALVDIEQPSLVLELPHKRRYNAQVQHILAINHWTGRLNDSDSASMPLGTIVSCPSPMAGWESPCFESKGRPNLLLVWYARSELRSSLEGQCPPCYPFSLSFSEDLEILNGSRSDMLQRDVDVLSSLA